MAKSDLKGIKLLKVILHSRLFMFGIIIEGDSMTREENSKFACLLR